MYTSMLRKAMLGDTATLNLDFTTGVLDSRLTFTRSGTGTYINSSGYVATETANTPRFEYDEVTLAPRGLLIEGTATNFMTFSQDQGNNATWNAFSTSVTRTTGQTDPKNTTTATKISFNATSSDAVISRAVAISNATPHTISVWMRADSGTVSNVRFGRAASAAGAIFPTLTTTWQRVRIAFTSSGTSDGIEIRVLTSGSPKTATIHIWGAQLELGSGASSYIPTGVGEVTRLADDAVIRSTAWTSLYSKPGTILVEYYRGEYGASDRSVLSIDTAATKNIHLKHANASAASGIFNSAGFGVANKLNGNVIGINKAAFSWSGANPSIIKYALNGNATVVSASSDIGATLGTWMTIGSNSTTGVSGTGTWAGYLNNSIKSIKYYSELLTDAEMIAKTT